MSLVTASVQFNAHTQIALHGQLLSCSPALPLSRFTCLTRYQRNCSIRTARRTIATADASLRVDLNTSVGHLFDRTGRAAVQAFRFLAMMTGGGHDQCLERCALVC